MGWSKIEKKAYAVLESVERSHWLADCPEGFDIYKDHNNHIFIFDPTEMMQDIGQGALRKVLRWAVRMFYYKYVCIHILDSDNVWAGLLTIWTITRTIHLLISITPLPTLLAEDFTWPSV